MSLTYKDAGVNINAFNKSISKVKNAIKQTFNKNVLCDIGGFSGLYKINFKKYKEPVLVCGCDGVGTKLKIAFLTNIHNTVGIDLVAMCINDIITCGATPLFFLDYFGCSKLKKEQFVEVMKGIIHGCKIANCSLLGGETAELPGMYQNDEYDLAGFAVGVVDKKNIIDGSKIKEGDRIIGLASSGLHSNGYSLARKVLFEIKKYKIDEYIPDLKNILYKELLKPTIIYSTIILKLISKFEIKGIANITGGGFLDNIPRILPEKVNAVIKKGTWYIHPIFQLIQKIGKIEEKEMFRTFNMGIGMVIVVSEKTADDVLNFLSKNKTKSYIIGEIKKGNKKVEIT